METFTIYTDGACSGNPGAGAWAFVLLADKKEISKSGFHAKTTNNRMELLAAIEALNEVEKFLREQKSEKFSIDFFSDSQYVKNGITTWIYNWKKNNWKTANKKPVANRDLWETLDTLSQQFSISWHWVKGHAGNKYNEICDALCQRAISENR